MSSKLCCCNEARISPVESEGAPSDAEDFEDDRSKLSYFMSELKILCLLAVLQRISEVDESERAEDRTLEVLEKVLEGENERV
jgi:hypothetical protein